MWCIYCHLNKINGKRYVGLTKQKLKKRWQNGFGYNVGTQPVFGAAIAKYGWNNFEHIILEDNIETLDEANAREKYWIAYYHTWVHDPQCNGYNITMGGDGMTGHIISEEVRKKISNTLKQNKVFCKKVICIELNKIFESCSMAEHKLNCWHVGECCNKQRETAGGYHWAFADDKKRQKELSQYKGKPQQIKKILCIETNEIFNSKSEAIKKYGIHVPQCCNGERKQTHGYHFKWIQSEK